MQFTFTATAYVGATIEAETPEEAETKFQKMYDKAEFSDKTEGEFHLQELIGFTFEDENGDRYDGEI